MEYFNVYLFDAKGDSHVLLLKAANAEAAKERALTIHVGGDVTHVDLDKKPESGTVAQVIQEQLNKAFKR